jgi:ATP-binding cassette subfamily F protein uup
MAVITFLDAQLAFGHVALLDHADFSLEEGERVGLIGRNGAGKSSLLKILAGLEKADDGHLQVQAGRAVVYVAQEPVLDGNATIFEAVQAGLADLIAKIDQYSLGEGDLEALQNAIEAQDGWVWEQRVTETLQRLGLDGNRRVSELSGGLKKRVALAQALVARPDVLLLDEPTNHLDLEAIVWLQSLLCEFKGSVITISHDRAFLDAVATRIVELDRGQLRSYPGNFAAYQTNKAEQLQQESVINAKADKLLAQEEIWIRKGVEARRTRAVARIERLHKLRSEHASRRKVQGSVNLQLDTGEKSGKLVAELTEVDKSYGDKVLVKNFSTIIARGDKVALMGNNGVGKTTLLKMLLGELAPDKGKVKLGSNLQIAYFDQMRDQLDLDASLEDFISPGSEWIEIGNQRKHVKSYLSDFLFSPARGNSPVRSLSGGERNRLLLARLFARPANVLVLDEPTNDLDIDTLELLEDLLADYNGTVFLVSHDRRFVDSVATSIIAWEGDVQPGRWTEYEGDVEDWMVQRARYAAAQAKAQNSNPKDEKIDYKKESFSGSFDEENSQKQPEKSEVSKKRKLSYKEQRELDSLPAQMAALEQEQAKLQTTLADGKLYVQDSTLAAQHAQRINAIDEELLHCLERAQALGA